MRKTIVSKEKSIRYLIPGLGLFLMFQTSQAKDNIRVEGYVTSSFQYAQNEVYGSGYYLGKLRVEQKIDSDFKAVLDFRGRSKTNEVELKHAFLRIKYSPWMRVKIGQVKKRFSAEEMVSKAELITIERSLLNRHMQPFGYVVSGQGLTIYRKYEGKGAPLGYRAGLLYNESRHLYTLLRFERFNIGPFQRVGTGGIVRKFTGTGQTVTTAFSLDGLIQLGAFATEIETVWGHDPVESHYRSLEGGSGRAAFVGGRMMFSHRYSYQERHIKILEPVILFSFLAPEVSQLDTHHYQCLLGINLYLHKKIRIRMNSDFILSNNKLDTDTYTYDRSTYTVEVQTRW